MVSVHKTKARRLFTSPPVVMTQLETPLGAMLAVASEKHVYLLEFISRKALPNELKKLRMHIEGGIATGTNNLLTLLQAELASYFAGHLKAFTLPLGLLGSPFQKAVWQGLRKVPYGQTRSYLEQTRTLGYARGKVRAVANANGANQLAIIIPCHRIINHNGALGGYGGGLERKRWLLEHERRHGGLYPTA